MRIILQILSGPSAKRRVIVEAGQTLRVGRTEHAEFACPDDPHMSHVHFAVEVLGDECVVQDIGSRNGTLVNGAPISRPTAVYGGDEIQAGTTRFGIVVPEEPPERKRTGRESEGGSAEGIIRDTPVAAVQTQPSADAWFTVEECRSGVVVCRGSIDEISPAQLALRLSQLVPFYLIVDFRLLGVPIPEVPDPPGFLFDWLPEDAVRLASPILVSHGELGNWAEVVEEGWGKNGFVCLFSNDEKSDLLAHLRNVMRVRPSEGDAPGGVLGLCWPNVMSTTLANANADSVQHLLAGIDGVLSESEDVPDAWQVFGTPMVASQLEQAGLRRRETEHLANAVTKDT